MLRSALRFGGLLTRHVRVISTNPMPNPKVATESLSVRDGKMLFVGDDSFHVDWLRHNCQCNLCQDATAGQRNVIVEDLKDLTITSAQLKDGKIEIEWNKGRENHHDGYFPAGWLEANSYHQNYKIADESIPSPDVARTFPTISYKEIMNAEDHRVLQRFLKTFLEKGLYLIEGIPPEPGRIVDICEKFCSVFKSVYGEIIDLIATDTPIDPGFTQGGLPFHTDLTYYCQPPGVGFISCIRFDESVIGGESTLLDMFPIVEEVKKHPKHFDALSRISATFNHLSYKWGDPHHMVAWNPHFELDTQGNLKTVRWNPATQASLRAKESDILDYYDAYKFLAEKISSASHVLGHRLKSGEALMVNNHRVLHGRDPYRLPNRQSGRHVQVLFGNLDELKSTYRSLSRDV